MNYIIETKNLHKTYKVDKSEIEVLKDINFYMKQGEFVSIMGPSGSGKSTLLYIIASLEAPTSGEVKINGYDLSKMNDKKKSRLRCNDIGIIYQFYNLLPELNVEENIMLPLLIGGRKIKQYNNKLKEILDIVGLSDRRRHKPRELSGGQQQRVAIARALIMEPEIILADEPIGNLDSKSGMEIMQLFKTLNKEFNSTILQVTHSEEASKYGNRLVKMLDGRIV